MKTYPAGVGTKLHRSAKDRFQTEGLFLACICSIAELPDTKKVLPNLQKSKPLYLQALARLKLEPSDEKLLDPNNTARQQIYSSLSTSFFLTGASFLAALSAYAILSALNSFLYVLTCSGIVPITL